MADLPRRTILIPLIVACALFMENLDSTVIATALPAISRSLREDPLRMSLAMTSYLLSLTVFIPVSGWVADRFGTRATFRWAIVVFTLSSLGCALSQNLVELILMRVVQGIGGAMMVPVGRLVLLRAIPKRELVAAMSYLTVPALLAPILGPPVGGFIATFASWRGIFLINLPIGVLGFALVTRYIEDSRVPDTPPLDLRGWLLAGLGLCSVVFGFESLGKSLLPYWALDGLLAGGALLLWGYFRHSRTQAHPIIDFSLLRIPTYGIAVGSGSIFRTATGAFSLLMPLMLQLGFGLSALQSGSITFAGAAGAMLMKTTAPRILRRFGFRRVLGFNTLLCSALMVACGTFRPGTPYLAMIGVLLLSGFFRSLQFTSVNTMTFADVDGGRMSHATSLSSTAQQLSMSLGIGCAAQALNGLRLLRGEATLVPEDFTLAFGLFALASAASLIGFRKLSRDAGDSVSGFRMRDVPQSGQM